MPACRAFFYSALGSLCLALWHYCVIASVLSPSALHATLIVRLLQYGLVVISYVQQRGRWRERVKWYLTRWIVARVAWSVRAGTSLPPLPPSLPHTHTLPSSLSVSHRLQTFLLSVQTRGSLPELLGAFGILTKLIQILIQNLRSGVEFYLSNW